ncbi:uroplakin-2 [Protopterus annectens]|uniref:uroplakin-2 n=1 Tax=Protopterus annectens TaxID=7888 RepID=UPI001CFB12EC|nr:uroplakin-2 [Protopterus annectens]
MGPSETAMPNINACSVVVSECIGIECNAKRNNKVNDDIHNRNLYPVVKVNNALLNEQERVVRPKTTTVTVNENTVGSLNNASIFPLPINTDRVSLIKGLASWLIFANDQFREHHCEEVRLAQQFVKWWVCSRCNTPLENSSFQSFQSHQVPEVTLRFCSLHSADCTEASLQKDPAFKHLFSMMRLGIVVFLAAVLVNEIKTQNFTITLVNDLVTGGVFPHSVVLSLPPCYYYGKNVNVNFTYENGTLQGQIISAFKVPDCRFKRALIEANSGNGYTVVQPIGYQLLGLESNTVYTVWYQVQNYITNLTVKTGLRKDFNDINVGFEGRSGGMVVITVLLSIAMFLLIIGLIGTLAMGSRK